MICPYCEQGGIMKARVKKNNEIINICEECDAVWIGEIIEKTGTTFEKYMEQRGYTNAWNEIEILERI